MNWFKIICLPILYFNYTLLFGQSNSLTDTNSNKVDYEKNADAVIILDSGYYTVSTDYNLLFDHTQKIKIQTEAGLPFANFEIPFSENDSLLQFTGEIISPNSTQKIDKRKVKIEKTTNGNFIAQINLTDAKVGDEIKFYYKLRLAGLENMNNWYFQNDIPVRKSTLTTKIPSFIFYYKFLEGQRNLNNVDRSITSEKFGDEDYNFQLETYQMDSLPAYRNEPDTPGEEFFISKLTFHLSEYTIPNQPTKYFLPASYEDLSINWASDSYFKQIYQEERYLQEKIDQIYHRKFTDEKNIRSLYYFIRNNFTADNSLYDDDLSETFKRRAGNEQQLNMLLAKMLNQAGFSAYLLALSTLDNRPVYPALPYFSLFNKFVVMVKTADQTYFLDASDPHLLFNMLSPNCINSGALMISRVNNGMIPLDYLFDDTEIVMAKITVTDSSSMQVAYKNTRKGYSVYTFDTKYLQNYKSYNDYLIETIFMNPNWNIMSHEIKDNFDQNKFVTEDLSFTTNLSEKVNQDIISIPSTLRNDFIQNPFPAIDRQNPITLYTPINRKGQYEITIPEGYSIQNIPQAGAMSLEDDAGKFFYEVVQNGNTINISYTLTVNKVIYLPSEYAQLSEFFEQVSLRFQQTVDIKKN